MTTNNSNSQQLVIIGTKKILHKRQLPYQVKEPVWFCDNIIEDYMEQYLYEDIERYYDNYYGNIRLMNLPDMD